MRSVVVDLVRRKSAERRGGNARPVTPNTDAGDGAPSNEAEIVRVHDVLEDLSTLDRRTADVMETCYFAGMTEGEIADSLGVNERTVRRDWQKARLLLAENGVRNVSSSFRGARELTRVNSAAHRE